MNIAILGAPGTGKTTLAQALRRHLQTLGIQATVSDAQALASPRDITLLCGLDLPVCAQHGQADADLRTSLARTGKPFHVIYGVGEDRLHNALYAIARECPEHSALLRGEAAARWQGPCERCSDAACEHRLFSRLMPH